MKAITSSFISESPRLISLIQSIPRNHISAVLVAVALSIGAIWGIDFGMWLWLLPFSLIAIAATVQPQTPSKRVFLFAAMIIVSVWLAAAWSILTVNDYRIVTISFALWMLPMAALLFVPITELTFRYMLPIQLLSAYTVVYDARYGDWVRASGIFDNPNIAAAFLSFGVLPLMRTRYYWISTPVLLVAIAATGSRAALGMVVVLMVGGAITKVIDWKRVPVLVVAALVMLIPLRDYLDTGLKRPYGSPIDKTSAFVRGQEFSDRVMPQRAINGLPVGFGYDDKRPVHNVFLHILMEFGALAALGWIALNVQSLKRPFDLSWWMLVMALGLGLLDMYMFSGPVAPFAWALWSWRQAGNLAPNHPTP